MDQLKKLKTMDGEEYLCACFQLYGCPIWIPINKAEDFDRQLARAEELFVQATKVVDQLQEIKELVDQISAARLH